MSSIVLTGASGFIGRQLLPQLLARYPRSEILALSNQSAAGWAGGGLRYRSVDLRDRSAVEAMVAEARPDIVIHLAAQSSVAQALVSPWTSWETNLLGTINLAQAVKSFKPEAAFIFASTAEVYGRAFESGQMLTESSALAPANSYARSKAACEYALQDLWGDRGALTILRIFNHIGPGQDERFVASAFAAQIARIEAGLMPPIIRVGDLSVERDFGDVRDLIDALVAIVGAVPEPACFSTYNICSGHVRPVQDLLDGLINGALVKPNVDVDPDKLRPRELRRVSASNAAIRQRTGWRPRRELSETLTLLLNHWRARVVSERE